MQDRLLIIGLRIRSLREAQSLSQEKLADQAGISPNYLGTIERGETNASLKILLSIADALNITISELLDIDPQDKDTLKEKLQALVSDASLDQIRLSYKYVSELLRVSK